MGIPRKLSRRTNHAKPRCQLYQPGFNSYNGCWLDGSWVTVPAEGFREAARRHEALYKGLHGQVKRQHHGNAPVPPEEMTPAQRQAWAHYGGQDTADVLCPNGAFSHASIDTAAGKPAERSLRWLRRSGLKVVSLVLQPDKSVTDNRSRYPADLLTDHTEPVNVWRNIVRQNRARSAAMSLAFAEGPPPGPFPEGATINGESLASFAVQVGLHGLMEAEEGIIQHERGFTNDDLETLDELRQEYVELRRGLQQRLGDGFEAAYQRARESHNHCARTNLDNSDGSMFCFVLPRFNPDGSHDPPGPRDVPWNRND